MRDEAPAARLAWQYEADKLLGINAPPWPGDDIRRQALAEAGLAHWEPRPKRRRSTRMTKNPHMAAADAILPPLPGKGAVPQAKGPPPKAKGKAKRPLKKGKFGGAVKQFGLP